MHIVSLDPSSIRTGYAVVASPGCLLEAGYFSASPKDDPIARILSQCQDLRELLYQRKPDAVVVEVSSGKIAGRFGAQKISGQAVYGMAVGALWCEARQGCAAVYTVRENVWTRRTPKRERQAQIAALYPQYAKSIGIDRGADVADAIGLALWWLDAELPTKTVEPTQ